MKSPFHIAVINDEISQDFGHSCEIISREFGIGLDRAAQHVEQKRDRAQ